MIELGGDFNPAGNFYFINLTETLVIPDGADVVLKRADAGERRLIVVGDYNSGVIDAIHIEQDGKLTIDGIIVTRSAHFGFSRTEGRGVVNNGTFILESGEIYRHRGLHPQTEAFPHLPSETIGGGVRNNGEFTMNGGRIADNFSRTYGGGGGAETDRGGAAVYNSGIGVVFDMRGGFIEGNDALRGNGHGAVLNKNGAEFNLHNGTIRQNVAMSGGAIANVGTETKFTMYNGNITDNSATRRGGGLSNFDGTITIINGEFINNVVNGPTLGRDIGGGAIVSEGEEAVLTIESGVFENNTAPRGGAIHLWRSASAEIAAPAVFRNNTADIEGGAIFVLEGTLARGLLRVAYETTFEGNSAAHEFTPTPETAVFYEPFIRNIAIINNLDISYHLLHVSQFERFDRIRFGEDALPTQTAVIRNRSTSVDIVVSVEMGGAGAWAFEMPDNSISIRRGEYATISVTPTSAGVNYAPVRSGQEPITHEAEVVVRLHSMDPPQNPLPEVSFTLRPAYLVYDPVVNNVVVTSDDYLVLVGEDLQFFADVTAQFSASNTALVQNPPLGVAWSIVNRNLHSSGTVIDENTGVLTVDEYEAANTITVRATATHPNTLGNVPVFGEHTVSVIRGGDVVLSPDPLYLAVVTENGGTRSGTVTALTARESANFEPIFEWSISNEYAGIAEIYGANDERSVTVITRYGNVPGEVALVLDVTCNLTDFEVSVTGQIIVYTPVEEVELERQVYLYNYGLSFVEAEPFRMTNRGESVVLRVDVSPECDFSDGNNRRVEWSSPDSRVRITPPNSDNPRTVTVSVDGDVPAPFDTTITATVIYGAGGYDDRERESVNVRVYPQLQDLSVELNHSSLLLYRNGGTANLTAAVSNVGPSDRSFTVEWASSNTNVVTEAAPAGEITGIISLSAGESGNRDRIATAANPGAATITVTVTCNELGTYDTDTVNVLVYTPVDSVSLQRRVYVGEDDYNDDVDEHGFTFVGAEPFRMTFGGEPAELRAAVTPDCDFVDPRNRRVYWESSNPNIAAVNQNGVVTIPRRTALSSNERFGTVTITATVFYGQEADANDTNKSEYDTVVIEVIPGRHDFRVWFAETAVTLPMGQTRQLRPLLTPREDVADIELFGWHSSNPGVVYVDEYDGTITALVPQGYADITVTARLEQPDVEQGSVIDELTATIRVNVREGVPSVSFDGQQGTVKVPIPATQSLPFTINTENTPNLDDLTKTVTIVRNDIVPEILPAARVTSATGNVAVSLTNIRETNPRRVRDRYTVTITVTNRHGESDSDTMRFDVINQYAFGYFFPTEINLSYRGLIERQTNVQRLMNRSNLSLTHEFQFGVTSVPVVTPPLPTFFQRWFGILFRPTTPANTVIHTPPPPGDPLDFVWTADDSLRWQVADTSIAQMQVLQGGQWQALTPDRAVSPFTAVRVVGLEDGETNLIITHNSSGVYVERNVTVDTLRGQLYFVRVTPAVPVMVSFMNGYGTQVNIEIGDEVHGSSSRGEIAIFETSGIVGDVTLIGICPDESAAYMGSINVGRLWSGASGDDRSQMYPFTTVRMHNITTQNFFSYLPNGVAYNGRVSVFGGLFRNGVFVPGSGIMQENLPTSRGGAFTVSTPPTIVREFNLSPADRLQFVYEVHFLDGDWAPQLIRMDGFTTDGFHIRLDDSIIRLQPWNRQGFVMPGITYYDYMSRVDVSTNNSFVGPSSANPEAVLTAVIAANSGSNVQGLQFVESNSLFAPSQQEPRHINTRAGYSEFLSGNYQFYELIMDVKQDFSAGADGRLTIGIERMDSRHYMIRGRIGDDNAWQTIQLGFEIFNSIGLSIPQDLWDILFPLDGVMTDTSDFGRQMRQGASAFAMNMVSRFASRSVNLPNGLKFEIKTTPVEGNPLSFEVAAKLERDLLARPAPNWPNPVFWSSNLEKSGSGHLHTRDDCPGLNSTIRAGHRINSGRVQTAMDLGVLSGFCKTCARTYQEKTDDSFARAANDYRNRAGRATPPPGRVTREFEVEAFFKAQIGFDPRGTCTCGTLFCLWYFEFKELGIELEAGIGYRRSWRIPVPKPPGLAVTIEFATGVGIDIEVRVNGANIGSGNHDWLVLEAKANGFVRVRGAVGIDIWIAAANVGAFVQGDVNAEFMLNIMAHRGRWWVVGR